MIPPGSIIGIIGGGQLGRMMANAASELGYRVHIFTPEHNSPACEVCWKTTIADYSDTQALQAFADEVDVITFEFENVPHESLALLESKKPVRPSAKILEISRNRVREKSFINDLGIGTAKWYKVTTAEELEQAVKKIGIPSVLKTSELGYDGKGQVAIRAQADLANAWESLKTQEAILEAFVDFSMEISVLVARGENGETQVYVPVQNIHKHHILGTTIAPAPVDKKLAGNTEAIAVKIATALDLKGLLAVEMFVTRDNEILVNELAPRPHNSGHWTMDACATSQFEQVIRAICSLPLGTSARHSDAEMKNLIGDDVKEWRKYLSTPNAKLHLYGKKEIRVGRKMGHVTFLKTSAS